MAEFVSDSTKSVTVTQADVTDADRAAVTAFHNVQIKRIIAGDKKLGDNRDVIEQAFARHRIEAEQRATRSTLSADAIRQGEGATTQDFRAVASNLWRHVKRGTVYEVIGTAELQAGQPQLEHAELVIYRGEDGKLWARNSGEFHDGRFVPATPASHASDGGEGA